MNRNRTSSMAEPAGMLQDRGAALLVGTQIFSIETEALQKSTKRNVVVPIQTHVNHPRLNTKVGCNIRLR